MELDNLKDEASKDTDISMTQISTYSLTLPKTTIKWLRYLSETQLEFEVAEHELSKAIKKQTYYYKHDYHLSLTAQEIKDFVAGDDKLSKLRIQYSYQREKLNFIENVVKVLNTSSFNIKNIIEWEKFKNGGF